MADDDLTSDDLKEHFVRWQSITIVQLTYAVNLVLGLSFAILAFLVNTLLNEKINPASCGQKFIFLLSLLALVTSAGVGIWCVINRLRDFRATKNVVRMQIESDKEIESCRALTKKLGKKTWLLFWWQIGTFSAGALFTVLSILASVSYKLL